MSWRRGLREALGTWPVGRVEVWALVTSALVVVAAFSALGLVLVHLLDDGPIGDADRAVAERLEDGRTPTWNTLSHYGSMLSDTAVKVALVMLVGGAMIVVWRRWLEGVLLALAVTFESATFLVVSLIVGRERPPVVRLDDPAPSGSFPSGHAAAAVAFYVTLYLIVRWHTERREVRAPFAVLAVAAPLAVAMSRVYRGMHHPLDSLAGLVLGAVSIVAVWRVLLAPLTPAAPPLDRSRSRSSPAS